VREGLCEGGAEEAGSAGKGDLHRPRIGRLTGWEYLS